MSLNDQEVFLLLWCPKLFFMPLILLHTYQDMQGFKTQKSCISLFKTVFNIPASFCHPLVIMGVHYSIFSRPKDHKFRKAMTQCSR